MMQSAEQILAPRKAREPLLVNDSDDELRSDERGRDHKGVVVSSLSGKKVLIVEDEFLVAVQVEDALLSFGCEPIGPITTLDAAFQVSVSTKFDIAVLDINLGGKLVYPLADELNTRGIPFLLVSGYSSQHIPEQYRSMPRVQKPFDHLSIRRQLENLLDS